jgi:phage-related protein
VIWLGDSLDRLAAFPPAIRQKPGFALHQAQIGQQHESAKLLRGFGEAVRQVRADDPSGT